MGRKKCPRCGHVRSASDRQVVAGTCPACGIAYNKWLARKRPADAADIADSDTDLVPAESLLSRLRATVLQTPEEFEPVGFWARLGLLVLLFVWGWSFILPGIDWERIGNSFLHNANLPFHEFGHVLFSPFGDVMRILGGSLFQVLLPLGLAIVFIVQRGDTFAASVALWWMGQNLIDVAPYIADAPIRALPLIRGMSDDYHDWWNLLLRFDALDQADTIASTSFFLGSVVINVSLAWGAYLLYLQWRRLH